LPITPGIDPLVSLWKGIAKPVAATALGLAGIGTFFHYVIKGPNKVSEESRSEPPKAGEPPREGM
jgi:formate dehydrogenase iron-sulfur subunit